MFEFAVVLRHDEDDDRRLPATVVKSPAARPRRPSADKRRHSRRCTPPTVPTGGSVRDNEVDDKRKRAHSRRLRRLRRRRRGWRRSTQILRTSALSATVAVGDVERRWLAQRRRWRL